jgi:hypothetical protein
LISQEVYYKFFTNKDGKYAWRPLQIINPVIYVYLINEITKEQNWELIINRFQKFQKTEKIECCSIPIISQNRGKSDKAETISNWRNAVEQKSLELSLDYNCFLNMDISDCYASIYTHTIPWALHGKPTAKEHKDDMKLIGNKIDKIIQCMQSGQTNGIPQGNTLMDFIAEMILGYADMLLYNKITEYNKERAEKNCKNGNTNETTIMDKKIMG